jgi:hypothetical protein
VQIGGAVFNAQDIVSEVKENKKLRTFNDG